MAAPLFRLAESAASSANVNRRRTAYLYPSRDGLIRSDSGRKTFTYMCCIPDFSPDASISKGDIVKEWQSCLIFSQLKDGQSLVVT